MLVLKLKKCSDHNITNVKVRVICSWFTSDPCQWVAKASPERSLGKKLLQREQGQRDTWKSSQLQHRSNAHPGNKTDDSDEDRYADKEALERARCSSLSWNGASVRASCEDIRAIKVCLCLQGPESLRITMCKRDRQILRVHPFHDLTSNLYSIWFKYVCTFEKR